jgi:hypothetical protein
MYTKLSKDEDGENCNYLYYDVVGVVVQDIRLPHTFSEFGWFILDLDDILLERQSLL